MGFKVTVHKNGAKHGEMHYSSEAVAVGMANKMKNAGADASVARCNGTGCGCMNANPRRRASVPSDSLLALETTIRKTEAMLPKAAVRAAREESGWGGGVMVMPSRSEMEKLPARVAPHAAVEPAPPPQRHDGCERRGSLLAEYPR